MKLIKTSKKGSTYVALQRPDNTFVWVIYHHAMDLLKMGYTAAKQKNIDDIIKLLKP